MRASRILANVIRTTGSAAVIAPLALAAFACGGGASSTTGPGGPSGNARYYLQASIDGAAWGEDAVSAAATGARWAAPGLFTISGYDASSNITILITLYNVYGPGTYALGVNASNSGGTAQVTNISAGWATPLSGAAGSVTITSLTQTEMAGTFTFVANGLLNVPATSLKNVTSGTFDLPVKANGVITQLTGTKGSSISGTIAGSAFNLATITATTSTTRGPQGATIGTTLTFGGGSTTYGMGGSVPAITGPGVYPLGPGSAANGFNATTLNASLTNGTVIQAWNSSDALSTGSVTITSFTPNRIQGSFSGNLGPGFGTSARINVSGTFDLAIAIP
ncbi:MAG TPA: DUF6252 family protein [Gemmatimonadaceae bacterium]|jgi:hypothetical protein|nr:DUF6252 family protein [Gemmatimonadaceae bacterium]